MGHWAGPSPALSPQAQPLDAAGDHSSDKALALFRHPVRYVPVPVPCPGLGQAGPDGDSPQQAPVAQIQVL